MLIDIDYANRSFDGLAAIAMIYRPFRAPTLKIEY